MGNENEWIEGRIDGWTPSHLKKNPKSRSISPLKMKCCLQHSYGNGLFNSLSDWTGRQTKHSLSGALMGAEEGDGGRCHGAASIQGGVFKSADECVSLHSENDLAVTEELWRNRGANVPALHPTGRDNWLNHPENISFPLQTKSAGSLPSRCFKEKEKKTLAWQVG